MKTRNACPIRKYNLQIHVPLPTMLSLSEVFCFATLSVGNLLVTWIGLGFSPMFSGMHTAYDRIYITEGDGCLL